METYASFGHIIVVMHDVSGQSEVTDLHYLALREKDIPGSQVPVNTLEKKKAQLQSAAAHCITAAAFRPNFTPPGTDCICFCVRFISAGSV